MALKVRIGGSRHTGLVAPSHKNIQYMTETDWELGNRRVPQYLLRLMAYKIEIEKLADKKKRMIRKMTRLKNNV